MGWVSPSFLCVQMLDPKSLQGPNRVGGKYEEREEGAARRFYAEMCSRFPQHHMRLARCYVIQDTGVERASHIMEFREATDGR